MKRIPAKFKVGDRVEILTFVRANSSERKLEIVHREPREFGTVVYVPKTSEGTYRVRFDGGYFLHGRDVPQALSEQWLLPAPDA